MARSLIVVEVHQPLTARSFASQRLLTFEVPEGTYRCEVLVSKHETLPDVYWVIFVRDDERLYGLPEKALWNEYNEKLSIEFAEGDFNTPAELRDYLKRRATS